MTWDEIAAQAGVALLVVRDGAVQRSNPTAAGLVEPYGATMDNMLTQVTAVITNADNSQPTAEAADALAAAGCDLLRAPMQQPD